MRRLSDTGSNAGGWGAARCNVGKADCGKCPGCFCSKGGVHTSMIITSSYSPEQSFDCSQDSADVHSLGLM